MEVTLLRHGRAGKPNFDRWPDDDDRPLTPDGEARLVKVAKGLAKRKSPEQVWASPAARTWQTAQIMHEHAGWPAPERSDLLDDGANPKKLTKHLTDLKHHGLKRIALVGHEPHLSGLASFMLTGERYNSGSSLKKGGAAFIKFGSQPGGSTLKAMHGPRVIAQMANAAKFSADRILELQREGWQLE